VLSVTFGDRLPGMGPTVRAAEVETAAGTSPLQARNIWLTAVGPRYFDTFDTPILAGRDFHDGDRTDAARTVIVNEAFARRFMNGASPVGRRLRYPGADPAAPGPWFEIVGMVRDIGMTPTDLGEAPYVFRPVTAATAYPLVMGVRTSNDPSGLAPELRSIAASVDPGLRLDDLRSLDDLAWRVEVPQVALAATFAAVVALGLFLSAAGIFSLMSVSVARRTREIGLRSALGASRARLVADMLSRSLVLLGSGIAAGNLVLGLFIWVEPEVDLSYVAVPLLATSTVILIVGLLACVEPARRALRINPIDALREA
jgi:hypothetical protein